MAERSDDALILAGRRFSSRLLLGTGKYPSVEVMQAALEASGTEIVTVAVRRIPLGDPAQGAFWWALAGYTLLPNTAGCFTAEDAVRTARLAREAGAGDLVKLEVIGDPRTLFPDTAALVEAAKILVREGFVVLPYTNDDPVVAKRLEDLGCAAVMPLAAPIGSGLGICNPVNLEIVRETVKVPLIVDAGVGTASDAARALELGADGVLMNTGVAGAKDPIEMARAMREAVSAGRRAFRAGRIPRKLHAAASSPPTGTIE